MNVIQVYYVAEKDLRGYVNDGGWAHSAAHGADVIKELAKYNAFGAEELKELLNIIKLKICQGKYVYIDREPERFCVTVRNVIQRGLIGADGIMTWLESFPYNELSTDHIEEWHERINIQNFYKTLYFALKKEQSGTSAEIMRIVAKVEELVDVL